MNDNRCCGTGSCAINEQGECWCGQKWDGNKMCSPELKPIVIKESETNHETKRYSE